MGHKKIFWFMIFRFQLKVEVLLYIPSTPWKMLLNSSSNVSCL